jgi:hemolysin activation/secretion protein
VRAYAVSEASSDRALLVSAELQRQDGPVRSRLFIDAGVGRIAHAALATDSHNTRHLAGAGLGADIRLSGDLILQASCAWRIGTADQADLSRTPRLWLQIGKSF